MLPRPAGVVNFRELPATGEYMASLYGRPQFRKLGLARALVADLIQEARTLGYDIMQLDALLDAMEPVVALDHKLGFVSIRPYGSNVLPGIEYMELRM